MVRNRADLRIALFPGQGSLKPGMGLNWADHPSAELFDQIANVADVDVRFLVEQAPLETLVRTDNAQLATFALSAVVAHAAQLDDVDLAIGHSLGEYSALYFAGILGLADATKLVRARGQAMAQASLDHPGGLVAVLGADSDQLAAVIQQFPTLVIANQNAPGQTVLAGSSHDLEALRATSKELGLKRVVPLDVGGAFHSPLMASAHDSLDLALADTTFEEGRMPVIANVDAQRHEGGNQWRTLLLRQLTSTVRFQDSVAQLQGSSNTFIELGPGGVLIGLVKRIDTEATLISLATPDDVDLYRKERS